METLLIKNATIVTLGKKPRIIKGSILVEDNKIRKIGDFNETADEKIDARKKIVIPGLICSHSHMMGAFIRGMPINEAPKNFPENLEKIWWKIDKRMNLNDIYISALLCLVEMTKNGLTSFAENHVSPFAATGSLDEIAKATEQAGLKGVLSLEVSDRDGTKIRNNCIAENERFIKKGKGRTLGNFGIHASFTVSDETLSKCVEVGEKHNVGFQIHVGEDSCDQKDSMNKYGMRVVQRLEKAGILGPKTIAAHCVHIDNNEIGILKRTNTSVTHNPQSNMNNGVGVSPVPQLLKDSLRVGIGTDGFTYNMFREAMATYLVHKLSSGDPRVMPADVVLRLLYENNAKIVGFDVGSLEVDKLADILVLNYKPPTPMTAGNFPWHFVFGMNGSNVETVIAEGKVIMENRGLKNLSEEDIVIDSKEAAQGLWDRIR